MPTHRTPPWKKSKPKTKSHTKLTAANIAWAKARAKKAGRRYPNLVDNMAAARRQNRSARAFRRSSLTPPAAIFAAFELFRCL